MDDALQALPIKPYICYTSPSNGLEGKGYRYRLIYCLDEPITKREDYYAYARTLEEMLALQDIVGPNCIDNRSYYPEQYWNGCRGCNIYTYSNILYKNNIILNNEFIKEYNNRISNTNSTTKVSFKHNKLQQNILCVSDTFMDDYWNLSYQDLLDKYNGEFPNIMSTPIEYDEDEPIVYYPDDYYEIQRPWYIMNGETYKLRDGDSRRKYKKNA